MKAFDETAGPHDSLQLDEREYESLEEVTLPIGKAIE